MASEKGTRLSDKPIIIILGVVATIATIISTCIAVFIFATGIQFLVDVFPSDAELTSVKVGIDAREGWQSTGVVVKEGMRLKIEVINGRWTRWKDTESYNTGQGGEYTCAEVIPADQCAEPLPDFPAGGLIGQIGNQVFGVGRDSTVVARQKGVLRLRINDGDDGLHDNDGQLTVEVTVEE